MFFIKFILNTLSFEMTTIYIRFLWRKRRERRRGGDRKRESREKKENENKNEPIFFRAECTGYYIIS